ncbi:MAG: ImmA/IrrE family metallo-endopeptidase [Deltaproteobacteria bacterium]|nr:ImmA/IrrE family metallo-endopeptidase [Deltaproteobacteria bacterium]
MTTIELAEHLKRQRRAIGLNEYKVADLAELSVERLRQIESGSAPTVWELNTLASALAVDPSALRSGKLDTDRRKSSARFRAPFGIEELTPQDARTLARAAEAARIHAFLRRLLGERSPSQVEAVRNVEGISSRGAIWEQGYSLGRHAREHLAPRHAAILSVQKLLESQGVLVLLVDLDSKAIDGASLYEQEASPTILLNRVSPRVRSRLSRRAVLGHELCHLLHDSSSHRDLLTVVSRSSDRSPTEQRANAFAPSFLAPKNWVMRGSGTDRDVVVRIAREWGLTFEGAVWHAKNLKLIPSTTTEELITERTEVDSGNFEVDAERISPSELDLEVEPSVLGGSALGDVAIKAASANLISVGRAVEILQLR